MITKAVLEATKLGPKIDGAEVFGSDEDGAIGLRWDCPRCGDMNFDFAGDQRECQACGQAVTVKEHQDD
jgi:ribosomal protein S27AE